MLKFVVRDERIVELRNPIPLPQQFPNTVNPRRAVDVFPSQNPVPMIQRAFTPYRPVVSPSYIPTRIRPASPVKVKGGPVKVKSTSKKSMIDLTGKNPISGCLSTKS